LSIAAHNSIPTVAGETKFYNKRRTLFAHVHIDTLQFVARILHRPASGILRPARTVQRLETKYTVNQPLCSEYILSQVIQQVVARPWSLPSYRIGHVSVAYVTTQSTKSHTRPEVEAYAVTSMTVSGSAAIHYMTSLFGVAFAASGRSRSAVDFRCHLSPDVYASS
jgi:hypothetical protein